MKQFVSAPFPLVHARARESLKTFGALAFYILAAGVMLFPLSLRLATAVPDAGDPLENTWVLASVGRALLTDPLNLYHANIFYPYPNVLAFSESQIASAVLGLPLFLATNNPILAYNFVFLAAFVLSGFNTYLLAFDLTRNRGGALVAGFAFAFWAYKFNHLSHINLITLQWLPLVLFALRRSLVQDRLVFPILFAVTFLLQALSSWYAALMTVLVVALYLAYHFLSRRETFNLRRWLRFAASFTIVLVPLVLIALPYFQVSRELQFARSLSEAERFSARPLSFISVSSFNWLYQNILPKAIGEALFPGALVLIFAASGLRKKYTFPDRAFWIFAILFFGIIAFGPIIHLTSTFEFPSPLYRALYEFVPGFQGTRAPARFFVVGMLGLTLLVANGLARLTKNVSLRTRAVVTAVALVALSIEYLTFPIRVVPIETNAQIPNVYRWLKQQPEGNVIELPTRVGDIEPITRAMYFSIYHQRALPIGYASFIPPTQNDFLHTLNTALETPSPRVPNLLREFDVRYVIVNRRAEQASELENKFAQLPAFESVYEDETHRVYRINADAPAHPLQFGCLAPAYAAPDAPYISYLTVYHTRRYPIVNADLKTHSVNLIWRSAEAEFTQTQTLKLPYVLRERVEGVPISVTAPRVAGDYELSCALDNAAPLQTQTVRVDSNLRANDTTSILELLAAQISSGEPKRGGEIITTFFWRRRAELRNDILMRVQLVDESRNVVSEVARQPVLYTYPVRLWRDNELVADSYALPIPPDAPSGTYRIAISALDENTNAIIPFRNPRGETTTEFSTEPFQIP